MLSIKRARVGELSIKGAAIDHIIKNSFPVPGVLIIKNAEARGLDRVGGRSRQQLLPKNLLCPLKVQESKP